MENLPPASQTPAHHPDVRKGRSPLAVVLGLSAIFFAIFLIVSGVMFMSGGGRLHGNRHAGGAAFFSEGAVGVIELKGEIKESKKTLKKLKAFAEDDDIRAVVLRIDSPGGAVAPSQEIYEAVKNYKKPILASMGSVAASGAYYVACGTRKIFANPGTITGSIGVIMEFADLEKLYEWAKIQRYSIKTGKFKDIGAEYRPMTADERALLQTMVDDVLLQFKQAVSTGRKIPLEHVTEIADGRIFSGDQAKKEKLVDELGSLDDAVHEAAKMAGIHGDPKVIYPERQHPHLLDLILNGDSGDEDSETQSFAGSGLAGVLSQVLRELGGDSHVGANPAGILSPGIYWLWTGH